MSRYVLGAVCILSLLAGGGCQSGHLARRKAFENPGGMWMPHQLAEQAERLKSLGVEDPHALSDPLAYPLGAIVWLGGCSASFVSPDGLIITNYHCANASLQYYSTPECNLFDHGFLARRREDERPGEIGKKVWVTQAIVDVTDTLRADLVDIEDPLQRYETIETRIKDLIAAHEQKDGAIRCSVHRYYEGQQYYLIKQLEIKDVRLVYSPPESIGNFGGFVDNWQWPRHTCDFTFYRAYVAPDGQPAEYAPENVPYRPAHYLRIADEPLAPHDVVMVAGYPGHTQRWQTAGQIRFAYEEEHPYLIRTLEEVLVIYQLLAEQSPDLRIKVTPSIKGVTNYLQLLEFMQENMRQHDVIAAKDAQQAALTEWVEAERKRRQKWGQVLDEIAAANEAYQETAYRDYLAACLTEYVPLVNAAHTIVRMAEERPQPDRLRDRQFQQRNWDRIRQGLQRMQMSYDPAVVKALLPYYLDKLNELPAEQLGEFEISDDAASFAAGLFTNALTVDDPNVRVALFEEASLEDLRASEDPVIRFVLTLRPLTKQIEDNQHIYDGRMALLLPEYVEARQAFCGRPLAPDANGTLRVTYGTVRGYRPAPEAPLYEPFTALGGLVAKHTGIEPFDAPPALLEAAQDGPFPPPYWSEALNAVPVNFLSDVDITGGNSGSATLNRKGQLVGLLFDGNSESLASNLLFMPEITRGIHVDIRFVLWVMKYVDGADNLLNELGIE